MASRISSSPPDPGEASGADALNLLDARYRAPLMSYFLRRVRDHAEAEDLTQELFLRMTRRSGAEVAENLDHYIFKAAANLLRDRARAMQARATSAQLVLTEDEGGQTPSPLVEVLGPERVLLGKEALAEALCVLDDLGERTRDIFILFRLERMKQKDIADLFGISVSAVEKHVVKALTRLTLHFGSECTQTAKTKTRLTTLR